MAAMTTIELLRELVTACVPSPLVESYVVREMDEDVLSVRVHLGAGACGEGAFISVFFNVTTEKAAFALVVENQRVYGKDNAKMGWHVHPFEAPHEHRTCQASSFGEFLGEVESHFEEVTE
jgi:hypothetical protein